MNVALRVLFLLAVALLAALPVGVGAQSQGGERAPTSIDGSSPETISGVVRNGTAGGEAPAGLWVTLRYQLESGELVEHDTVTQPDGSFTFTGLPAQGRPGFEVRTDYLGVEYAHRALGEPLEGPLQLTVYELTSDFDILSVVDDTLAVTGADGQRRRFAVLEAVKIRNPSDRTFVADTLTDGPMSMVRFSLPEGASDLEVEASLPGGHVLQVDRGFALTMPVPPGDHDILYVYRVPYEESFKQYTPNFPMGAETFRVMVIEGVAESSGPGMRVADNVTIGETEYRVLEAGPLPPGQRAAVMLSDLPQPTLLQRAENAVRSDGFRRGALPGALGVVLVVAVGVVLLRRRRGAQSRRDRNADAAALDSAHAGIIAVIAELDELFERGAIAPEDYRVRREELVRLARDTQ
ncbi:MAG: hypothetical protein OXK21_01590 [Chloroflexota bacterium]|nr:hypothetical protein [Chloroflexota bacterium]